MTRVRVAAWCWILTLLMIPAQVMVSRSWPRPYSWSSHLISDLGATMCGIADRGARVERFVCSPAHMLANTATVLSGLLLVAGAVLLWRFWPRPRAGQAASVLLALGGVGVVGVGLVPWNQDPDLHNLFALLQAPLQWGGMLLMARATWVPAVPRILPAVTLGAVFVSIVGFVLFLGAVSGGPPLRIGLGTAERIAFDTLTLWGAAAGVMLLVVARRGGSGRVAAGAANLAGNARSRDLAESV